MRDPNRIQVFCSKLAKAWEKVPDWRFGQLITNVMRAYDGDIFFPEDDVMIKIITSYIDAFSTGDNAGRYAGYGG